MKRNVDIYLVRADLIQVNQPIYANAFMLPAQPKDKGSKSIYTVTMRYGDYLKLKRLARKAQ
jgi:hypothetical protein